MTIGKPLRQLIEWFSGNQLATQRFDRQFSAGHLCYLSGPGAGGVDDYSR
jgi:hypothetical protein